MVDSINILITGAGGQLGSSISDISKEYDYNFHFKTKQELNIGDFPALENLLKKLNISTVINCAAYTNVDKAEKDIETAKRAPSPYSSKSKELPPAGIKGTPLVPAPLNIDGVNV